MRFRQSLRFAERRIAAYQQTVDARVAVSGWRKGIDWASRVYLGAAHEGKSWAARLPEIFVWLLEDRVTNGD